MHTCVVQPLSLCDCQPECLTAKASVGHNACCSGRQELFSVFSKTAKETSRRGRDIVAHLSRKCEHLPGIRSDFCSFSLSVHFFADHPGACVADSSPDKRRPPHQGSSDRHIARFLLC